MEKPKQKLGILFLGGFICVTFLVFVFPDLFVRITGMGDTCLDVVKYGALAAAVCGGFLVGWIKQGKN